MVCTMTDRVGLGRQVNFVVPGGVGGWGGILGVKRGAFRGAMQSSRSTRADPPYLTSELTVLVEKDYPPGGRRGVDEFE
jgi:hypothetical protein